MSLFVFVFLFIFRPFGLGTEENILSITAGFGITCLVVMLFLNAIIVPLLPSFFDENNWFVWKELVWVLLNVALVGIANALYTVFIFDYEFSFTIFAVFELYTVAVAVLPLLVSVLINFSIKKERFEKTSNEMSQQLTLQRAPKNKATILLEGLNDSFEVHLDTFLFAQASDNYVEIYFINGTDMGRYVLRKTLKATYACFASHETIQQVHRSFIVNLEQVAHVSGNAQGLKLHFELAEQVVPVSRNLTEKLRTYFATHH